MLPYVVKARASSCLWLLLCFAIYASQSQAHLLNMTEAVLLVDGRQAQLTLKLDPSRYFSDRNSYYQASLQPEPLAQPEIKSIVEQALAAVEVHTRLSSGEENSRVGPWLNLTVNFDPGNRALYLDPLQWPKVTITADLLLPATSQTLWLVFTPDFIFEEPISLTLKQATAEHGKTRWLIAKQESPKLLLDHSFALEAREPPAVDIGFYFGQGFWHILPLGVDHVLFVLALALARVRLRALITLVSLFTLSHCISLLVSTYGVVRVPSAIVEPLIALTIAWAGVELIRNKSISWGRYLLVFVFGLIHGLGFAGALAELGLPTQGAVLALLVFNLGVEAGQLLVVFAAVISSFLWSRLAWNFRHLQFFLGSFIAALGLLWAVMRLFQ